MTTVSAGPEAGAGLDEAGLQQAKQFQMYLVGGLVAAVALLGLVMVLGAFLAYRAATKPAEPTPPPTMAVAASPEPSGGFDEAGDFDGGEGFGGEDFGGAPAPDDPGAEFGDAGDFAGGGFGEGGADGGFAGGDFGEEEPDERSSGGDFGEEEPDGGFAGGAFGEEEPQGGFDEGAEDATAFEGSDFGGGSQEPAPSRPPSPPTRRAAPPPPTPSPTPIRQAVTRRSTAPTRRPAPTRPAKPPTPAAPAPRHRNSATLVRQFERLPVPVIQAAMALAGVRDRKAMHHRPDLRFLIAAALAEKGSKYAGPAFRDAVLMEDAGRLLDFLEARRSSFEKLPAGARSGGLLAALVRVDDWLEKGRRPQAQHLIRWTLGFPGAHQVQAYAHLGTLRRANGDAKGAAWAYKKALELGGVGETVPAGETLKEFERALEEKGKTDVGARLTHIRLVRAERDYEQDGIAAARDELEQVVRLHPEGRTPLAHLYAGEARKALEDDRHEEVFPLAKASLDLDRENVLAHRVLGDLSLLVKKDWDKAHYHFRLAAKYGGLLR